MNCRWKLVSPAIVAILVLGALVTQSAVASPLTVEGIVEGGTVFTTGDQDGGTYVFKTSGGTVSCTEASFTGSGAVATGGRVNEQTAFASFPTEKVGGGNNCTAFGFAGTHIKMNECTATSTTATSLKAGEVTWSGSTQLHLVCPTGKQVEITPTAFGASLCTQFVAAQTPTGGHTVGKNVTGSAPMDVTKEVTLTGIHYTGTGSSCGNSETHSDATLTGSSTGRCYSDSARTKQVGCTFS